jgi:hypothetical protein
MLPLGPSPRLFHSSPDELLRARLADAEVAQQSVNSLSAKLLGASITEE